MNRSTFIKIMMLTTSGNDGEALSAVRRANSMLKREAKSWEDIIVHGVVVPTTQRARSPPRAGDYVGPEGKVTSDDIDIMFDFLLQKRHSVTYMHFLQDIHSSWNNKGYLTRGQYNALQASYERNSR